VKFVEFAPPEGADGLVEREEMVDLPVEVVCELGATSLTLEEIAQLKTGSVIVLNRGAGEPIPLKANGRQIAEGEIFLLDNRLACRISRTTLTRQEEQKGTKQ